MDRAMLLAGLCGIGYVLYGLGSSKVQIAIGVSSIALIAVATNSIIVEHMQKENQIILQK